MNIYLHVEIAVRELDSKILLATLAASRGHQVIISDLNSIKRGLNYNVLPPGIFHTKSLTPNDHKIAIHQLLLDKGFGITSIDEEGGLLRHGYENFAKERYSDESIRQSSAIFGWGSEDTNTLKKVFPRFSNKIHKTGSARVDLWKSQFSSYWKNPKILPTKPFLLISSNLYLANYIKPFYEWGGFKSIKQKKGLSSYESNPDMFKKQFYNAAEDHRKLASFIEAIDHLSKFNNGYDIVLRPHPLENVDAWKIYLKGIPNVHVIREGSITPWVNCAFAIMHNSCTTALEASVSKKPIITYLPFQQNFAWEIPNELGYKVNSLEDLSLKVNQIFNDSKNGNLKEDDKLMPEILSKKIFIDEELAANKMIKIWESLKPNKDSWCLNLKKFEFFLKAVNIKKNVKKLLTISKVFKNIKYQEDPKFPTLIKNDIYEKIISIQNILEIREKIDCKVLSDRTILIKKV